MPPKCDAKVGDVLNGRRLLRKAGTSWEVLCVACGKRRTYDLWQLRNHQCICARRQKYTLFSVPITFSQLAELWGVSQPTVLARIRKHVSGQKRIPGFEVCDDVG